MVKVVHFYIGKGLHIFEQLPLRLKWVSHLPDSKLFQDKGARIVLGVEGFDPYLEVSQCRKEQRPICLNVCIVAQ
jgi:hypothetical protein